LSVLIGRESGGNPNAINNWDSNAAAGHPSQGLMQTIPSTFMAYHQPGTSFNILDPIANIAAGINYIRAVYGDISNVQQANPNLPPKGYDSGGWLPPGITVAYNGTGEHERVLTGPQYRMLTASASSGSARPINISVYPRAEHSEADIADMVSRRLEFAMRANV
jgi:SLT domain-containing protein